ncbi:hypothetical protein niasHS_003192 [Heterodera schachtii]|uniref:Uncharacterized protein n=1 Tax=Heterodera schachtii TaxID=97005 RepID=A0ABD2KGC7_HETSC
MGQLKTEEKPQKRQIEGAEARNNNDPNQKKQKPTKKLEKNKNSFANEANSSAENELMDLKIRFEQNFFAEKSDCQKFDEFVMRSFNRTNKASERRQKETANSAEKHSEKRQINGKEKNEGKIRENCNGNSAKIATKGQKSDQNETKSIDQQKSGKNETESIDQQKSGKNETESIDQQKSGKNETESIDQQKSGKNETESIDQQKSGTDQSIVENPPIQTARKFLMDPTKVERMVKMFSVKRSLRWKELTNFCTEFSAPLKPFIGAEKRRMEQEIKQKILAVIHAGRSIDSALISIELSLLPFAADLSAQLEQFYNGARNVNEMKEIATQIAKQMICALIEPIDVREDFLKTYIKQLQQALPQNILLASAGASFIRPMEFLTKLEMADFTSGAESSAQSSAQKLINLNFKLYNGLYKVSSNLLNAITISFEKVPEIGMFLQKTKAFVRIVIELMRGFVEKAREIGLNRAKIEKCEDGQ